MKRVTASSPPFCNLLCFSPLKRQQPWLPLMMCLYPPSCYRCCLLGFEDNPMW
ncbi:unnamed protein product [Brassica napus]|uniref:Uncharacterized protein n=2 Tax=Brassica TaxID=3705 RepID=A0A3P6BIZ1_BRACM|nr:unnamed protein product [Brassica napus]CAF2140395.1 unnamed protein product [Brassica napus]VDD05393.1 unnamed protein product [Brassica rapa]